MPHVLLFLCVIALWLLGWTILLGMSLLGRPGGDCRPLCLLDRDDIPES